MKHLYRLWWITLFFKLIISYWLPLFHDEAYYWFWGHHLQLSYYDHPPAVAWLFFIGQWLEPFGSAVRWPGVLLGHLTLLIWIEILKPHFTKTQFLWWFTLALTLPFVGPGSLIITPDVPLMFFWSLSIYCFLKAAKTDDLKWYLSLGLSLGFGFLSKYHIVIFPLGAIYWLIHIKKAPRLWPLTISILGFFLGSSPVWIWNMQHDFASFTFQLKHGLESEAWDPMWPLTYILGQIALMTPYLFYTSISKKPPPELSWLKPFTFAPILFFLATSFRGPVEANWPLPAYLPLIALAVASVQHYKHIKNTVVFCTALFITILIATPMNQTWIHKKTKLREFDEFDPIVEVVNKYEPAFFRSYQMASKVNFETKKLRYKLRGFNRPDFYDYLIQSKPNNNYFVFVEKGEILPSWARQNHSIVSRTPVGAKFEVLEVHIK